MASSRCCRKKVQLSLFSASTMANASGKIPLFPSREIAQRMTPPYGPFKWHPSIPTNGLHPLMNPFFIASKQMKNLLNTGLLVCTVLSTCRLAIVPGFALLTISA
jgi:hypothetical protein